VLSQQNAGAASARNSAIAAIEADFVGYLDADDALADEHMLAMLRLIHEYPGRDIYSSDGLSVFGDGTTELVFGYGNVVELTIEDLLLECRILGGGALVRAESLRALGGFRAHMYGEDYDLWLRALASGLTHVAAPEPLYVYHRSVSGQKSDDFTSGYLSAVEALEDLLRSGLLNPDQQRIARDSIANYRVGPLLEEHARFLRRRLERILGERGARAVWRVARSLSRPLLPLRRAFAGKHRVDAEGSSQSGGRSGDA
jgi:GT2 family glycosyltransferase